jgi:hypothetical protein
MLATDLPMEPAPLPAVIPHFPDRLHAYVWRNWQLVPVERLAQVVGAVPEEILRLGKALGLGDPPPITTAQRRRSSLTVIRRNWHLLPYEQLLELLGWTPEQMAYTLREDDFLFAKLGNLKPRCEPLSYCPPGPEMRQREHEIARLMAEQFPNGVGKAAEPLFGFISQLSQPVPRGTVRRGEFRCSPRFVYSYFALYGDPLLEREADPYPDGYLARMAEAGADGIWIQGVLSRLAPFPWDPRLSDRYEERLRSLEALVARARSHGMGVYVYLNEPRAMPLAFYDAHPQFKGVVENDYAALCTSDPSVREYLTGSVASLCRAVPDLAGLFTITASENLTHCWSHGKGAGCPRCGRRSSAEVIAEVNTRVHAGILQSGSGARLIVWDWGWPDDQAEAIIQQLPAGTSLMSVSEWNLPIQRGGVESRVGEYSLSAIGPGPRARRHWEIARQRGLKTVAKIQASNTWELSTVPYIPVAENVARHAARLSDCQVDGMMLSWTLGGYPSPNLEVVAEMGRARAEGVPPPTPEAAMESVAARRFGPGLAPAVVAAWRAFSDAFGEFPYHAATIYQAPLQLGPANLLWEEPTGYRATMVGFPYDDLDAWCAIYPPEIFVAQLEKVAGGFDRAIAALKRALPPEHVGAETRERRALRQEIDVAEAAAIHFRSVANQARFVQARRALAVADTAGEASPALVELERALHSEADLARRLFAIQVRDSRIGFEASNQYAYVPADLAEKVLNCRHLLSQWLPSQRARYGLSTLSEEEESRS